MNQQDYVSTRRFGDASVSVISDGSGQSTIIKQLVVPEEEWRSAVPEADAQGQVVLGYNVVLVRTGDANVLIDLGFDDPSPESQWREPNHRRSPGAEAGLASLGLRPEDVTHVVVTHAHGDHFAGATTLKNGERVARYPRARHFLHRADWEGNPNRARPEHLINLHLGTIERLGLLELVDGDREVVPGVTMIHAPGESPGHSIVRVGSRDGVFYFLGDLFHHPCEVEHLDWVSAGRNQSAMRASRDRLIARAVPEGATLAFGHRPFPAWGRIVPADGGYRWEDDPR